MNIPRFLLFIVLIVCCAGSALKAQVVTKGSHHLYLGYNLFSPLIPEEIGLYVRPLTATYQYAFGNRITAGAQLGYSGGKSDHFTRQLATTTFDNDVLKYFVVLVSLKADFHYLKNKKLDLYSGLSLDFSGGKGGYASEPHGLYRRTHLLPGIHALGCRYMVTPQIGVYSEASLSMIGFATFGVSARLGNKDKN